MLRLISGVAQSMICVDFDTAQNTVFEIIVNEALAKIQSYPTGA